MKSTFKRAVVLILLLCIAAANIVGCATGTDTSTFDAVSIKTFRDIPGITEEEIAAIEALISTRQSFSYGSSITTDAFMLADGTYAGFSTLFTDLLTQLFGVPFIQELHLWGDLMDGFLDKSIDFIGDLTPTPERMQTLYMSSPISERTLSAFIVDGVTDVTTANDLHGLDIAFTIGSITADFIMESYPELEFNIVYVDDITEAHEKLLTREVDAFVVDTVLAIRFIDSPEIVGLPVLPMVFTPISMSTANPELEPVITAIDRYLEAGGFHHIHSLYRAGNLEYASFALLHILDEDERAYIQDLKARGGKVPIAMEYDHYPISFYNHIYDEFQGISRDILDEISKLTGIEFEVINSYATTWHEILYMLLTGEVALVSELKKTEERQDSFLWSEEPYFKAQFAFLSRSDYPYLAFYQIPLSRTGVSRGTASEEMYRTWFSNDANLFIYDSQDDGLAALEKGEIDLFFSLDYTLIYQTHFRERLGYKINVPVDAHVANAYFGFNTNEEVLRSIVSKAQRYVETERIARGWTSRIYDQSRIIAEQRSYYLTIFAIGLAVSILILFFLLVRNMKSRAMIKTALGQLNEANERVGLMLNATPLICNVWSADYKIIDCNEETTNLYEMEKQEYIERFMECTPQFQSNGQTTVDYVKEKLDLAFRDGRCQFELLTNKLDGTMIPLDATLTRVVHGDGYAAVGYGRDLRDQNKMLEAIVYRDKLVRVVNQMAGLLLNSDEDSFKNILDESMRLIAEAAGFDCVYLRKNYSQDGELYCSRVFEWSPEKTTLATELSLKYSDVLPGWEEILSSGQIINKLIRDMSQTEQENLSQYGILSILVMPIFIQDQFWGFVGFDDCQHERLFTQEEESILHSASMIIANSLIRNEMFENVLEASGRQKALNEMSFLFLSHSVEEFGDKMSAGVKIIADLADIDRLTVWQNFSMPDGLHTSQIYGWDWEMGGTTPPEDEFLDVPITAFSQNWELILSGDAVVNGPSRLVGDPRTAQTLIGFGIVSALITPITVNEKNWGFVLFEDRRNERVFDEKTVEAMRSAAYLCANTVMRMEMETELEKALVAATGASKAKSDFLAKMSHEIRTPMNAIIGMTELALRGDMSSVVRDQAMMVRQAGVNLLSIIDDILDFSKIESGNMQIMKADYSLSSMLHDVISIIRMRTLDTQIRFAVFLDSKLPDSLNGDETRIRQVLINILGNAVKYTDMGHVSFKIYGKLTGRDAIDLHFVVEDTGKGIKKEDFDKVFSSYHQLQMESNRETEGVGLGLAITRNIVHAMDGDISVESELGSGSTFSVVLPQKINEQGELAKVEDPDEKTAVVYERRKIYAESVVYSIKNLGVECEVVQDNKQFTDIIENQKVSFIFISHKLFEKNKEAIRRAAGNFQIVLLTEFGESIHAGNWSILSMPANTISVANVFNGISDKYSYNSDSELNVRFTAPDAKVLVVDDINTNLKVTSGLLLPYRMKVDLCNSGMEAIEAVSTREYDLVFMDHRMPEMDGVEATGYIREMGKSEQYFKEIPIIALTANAVTGMKEMFLENGFDDFLSKPIDTVRLNTILEMWIPKEKQVSSSESEIKPANKNQLPSVAIDIAGIDVEKGIQMSGGMAKNYYENLITFHEDGKERIGEIERCLENDYLSLYKVHIHALKGAADSIAAGDELVEAANALEMAGERGDLEFLKANTNKFLVMLDKVLNNINDALL